MKECSRRRSRPAPTAAVATSIMRMNHLFLLLVLLAVTAPVTSRATTSSVLSNMYSSSAPTRRGFGGLHDDTVFTSSRTSFGRLTGTQTHASVFGIPRGGASKKRGGRVATLSSSTSKSKSSQKTATGKKKVGAAKAAAAAEKKSALSDTMAKYGKILPLTRIYITLVAVATLLGLILGEELTQTVLALDPIRIVYGFEIWRPLSAATFLGPPSIGWLMSGYYLFQYGSTLERAYGTAQHLVFLFSQMVILSLFSALAGQPFFAQSMITSMLHVLSRATPHAKVKWLVFTVPYWSLPYGLMASDVLQSQSPMAALPHVLGILSGHFYQFYKFVWPKMGGEDWLVAPDALVRRLDPDARQDDNKASIEKALKARKRKKGRKLGGS